MQRANPGIRLVFIGLPLMAVLTACAADPPPRLTYAERDCYRTLAEVDCHAQALPDEENRRVGFYDEPVRVEQRKAWPLSLFY